MRNVYRKQQNIALHRKKKTTLVLILKYTKEDLQISKLKVYIQKLIRISHSIMKRK